MDTKSGTGKAMFAERNVLVSTIGMGNPAFSVPDLSMPVLYKCRQEGNREISVVLLVAR